MLFSELQPIVNELVGKPSQVRFSIFKDDPDKKGEGNYRDKWYILTPNLRSEKPVIEGEVRFFTDYWRFTEEAIYSRFMENPTWADILKAFDTMIEEEGDGYGVFLEGLYYVNDQHGAKHYKFVIGS